LIACLQSLAHLLRECFELTDHQPQLIALLSRTQGRLPLRL
jgi:hypothetical protein